MSRLGLDKEHAWVTKRFIEPFSHLWVEAGPDFFKEPFIRNVPAGPTQVSPKLVSDQTAKQTPCDWQLKLSGRIQ